ncbi:Aste57867_14477 [Aphanomyces stellatus]|uniref:Aste57867_14477 protein n=1 Tax=Aphanomyces stellatus TaxID=120398 RepID=A0A485L1L0_9STRA|nr:hypothetical protein As57867_014423 [Aphanomyces stellatus]VFT91299.1 Aste57867_14477 [Aphanomyces stellatus]
MRLRFPFPVKYNNTMHLARSSFSTAVVVLAAVLAMDHALMTNPPPTPWPSTPLMAPASPIPSPSSTAICPGPVAPTPCFNNATSAFLRVAGNDGPFCALGPNYCSVSKTDSCPGPQVNLPYGSYCAFVNASNRFMCLPHTRCADNTTLESHLEAGQLTEDAVTDPSPTEDTSSGSGSDSSDGPTDPPAPTSHYMVDDKTGCLVDMTIPDLSRCSGPNHLLDGWAPISVQGRYHFCTQVTAARPSFCVATIKGNCPTAQPHLPFGSECQLLNKTKVYGCVPRTTCLDPSAMTPPPAPTGVNCVLDTPPTPASA